MKIETYLQHDEVHIPATYINKNGQGWTFAKAPFSGIKISVNSHEWMIKGLFVSEEKLRKALAEIEQKREGNHD
jgi:hypothetical protein